MIGGNSRDPSGGVNADWGRGREGGETWPDLIGESDGDPSRGHLSWGGRAWLALFPRGNSDLSGGRFRPD